MAQKGAVGSRAHLNRGQIERIDRYPAAGRLPRDVRGSALDGYVDGVLARCRNSTIDGLNRTAGH